VTTRVQDQYTRDLLEDDPPQIAEALQSWIAGIRVAIGRVNRGMTDWNARVTEEFHAKRGRGVGRWGDSLLLLTTRGAKSGVVRTTPLVYHRDGERYIIAASKGGAPAHPSWYHNLVKHRDAEIEVGTEKIKVRATPIPDGPERDRLYEAHGKAFAAFRDYPMKTKRIIPVVVLERVP
jgi:deazaflavin-dependent oxidoreductase (nitroreductase family)